MRFSKRIYALRDAVNIGESVADIGTDHGYVPMLLVRDKISPFAIMSDISEDSLAKSKETFNIVGIDTDDSKYRVGDGLSTIESGEVDTVIIAGLGGHTIVQILSDDIDKSKSFSHIIMQPRKHSGALRYWLYNNGFTVTDEILSSEGKFVCEIIKSIPVRNAENIEWAEDDIRWAYPISLRGADKNLLDKRVGWKISSIKEQIQNMSNSDSDNKAEIAKLKNDLIYLQELIGYDEEA